MSRRAVAVAGATGLVGQVLLRLLADHPWYRASDLLASERSAGRPYAEAVDWRLPGGPPEEVADRRVRPAEGEVRAATVFSCLPSDVARELELRWSARGHDVFTNASSHRLDPGVPLLVPEVNGVRYARLRRRDQAREGVLVANPNCSVSGLALALEPLHRRWTIDRVFVTTLQSASGAGLEGLDAPEIPHNVLPRIPGEEEKIRAETRKLLGGPREGTWVEAELDVVPSAYRVPVRHGHVLSVVVEGEDPLEPGAAGEAWRAFRAPRAARGLPSGLEAPVRVHESSDRPQPRRDREVGGGMQVQIGRIRGRPGRIAATVLVHNLVRGAAGGALLNAEYVHSRDGPRESSGDVHEEPIGETTTGVRKPNP